MTTESFRKEVSKRLSELSENDDIEASESWPPDLSSSDRKYIHQIAASFGLFTLSEGVGLTRFIKVHKKDPGGIDPARRRAYIKSQNDQKSSRVEIAEEHIAVLRRTADGAPQDDCSELVMHTKNPKPVRYDRPMDHLPMSLEKLDAAQERRKAGGIANFVMDKHRRELPAWEQRAEILELVENSSVVLISGETGCGKSTQVPQFLLDANDKCRILVAQPRRLAATSLCQRVVQERGTSDVGYNVPMDRCRDKSRLVFCTTSVMRRRLYDDSELEGITHIIFDEVHERDKVADFTLIFLRDLIRRRPDLRLILMSATLQLDTFVEYFGDMAKLTHIPGRMYPVQSLYMDQIVATLWKTPPFRKWLGPGILSANLDMDEKDWKRQVFHNTNHGDGLWGLAHHIRPYLDGQLTKQKLADGLRRHDVLQQSGLFFDFLIIEAIILHIDRMHKAAIKSLDEAEAEAKAKKKAEAAMEDGEEWEPDANEGEASAPNGEEPEKDIRKQPGAVLIFLTGWNDIDRCMKILQQDLESSRFLILPLHGQISMEQQREVFQPAEPGVRKIVLATNIAEASITVPDVEFVIDSGRAKDTSYDPFLKIGTLTTSWISRAAVKQRAGRAGRTKGGLCFHIFSQARLNKLDSYTPPELLRSPLEETCLNTKLLMIETGRTDSVEEFLQKAPSPPEKRTLSNALEDLRLLGAFVNNDDLTHLGHKLCHSSLPPGLMKTCLWGALFGVLDEVLQITWALAFTRDPFMMTGKGKEQLGETRMQAGNLKKQLAAPFASDHIALVRAFKEMSKNPNWAQQKGLNPKNFRGVHDGANKLRQDIPNINYGNASDFASRNKGNESLLIAVLAAGLYPNIAVKRNGKSVKQMEVKGGKIEAMLHGSSAYGVSREQGEGTKDEEWVVFHELVQMESNYSLKCASYVPNLVMLLMCGDEEIGTQDQTLLNGWAKFNTPGGAGHNIKDIRRGLRTVFKSFCADDLRQPSEEVMEFVNNTCTLISKACGGSFTAVKRQRDNSAGWSMAPPPRRNYDAGNQQLQQHRQQQRQQPGLRPPHGQRQQGALGQQNTTNNSWSRPPGPMRDVPMRLIPGKGDPRQHVVSKSKAPSVVPGRSNILNNKGGAAVRPVPVPPNKGQGKGNVNRQWR